MRPEIGAALVSGALASTCVVLPRSPAPEAVRKWAADLVATTQENRQREAERK